MSRSFPLNSGGAQLAAGLDGDDLARVVAGLRAERQRWRASQQRALEQGARDLPSRDVVDGIGAGANSGSPDFLASNPVTITTATVATP